MSLETGVRVGRYEIGRKLGQGGFGILYAARDHELGRDVAIKFLRPEHLPRQQLVQRFLQEARAAARVTHPGIVTVYETGQVNGTNTRADGTVYIAMELLAGDTLANRMTKSGKLPYRIAVNYCRQLATALEAAHQAGIVHRDLKPQNIFLVPDANVLGGERIKILDFGIAKLVDEMGSALNTHSMLMLGTPMYMSPEQCRSSARVDARSDIYALGCMLFEMVCGRTPFSGDPGELIAMHQLMPAPAARTLEPELPIVLDQLITAMLAKDPGERPQTMGLVLDALTECEDRSLEPPTRTEHRELLAEALAPATLVDAPSGAPATMSPPTAATVPSKPSSKAAALARLRERVTGRLRIAIGAGAAVLFGVTVAVCSSGSETKRVSADASVAAVVEAPADAAAALPVEPKLAELKSECLRAQAEQRWGDLHDCGERYTSLEPVEGTVFVETAKNEIANDIRFSDLEQAARAKNLKAAKAALDGIPSHSVYHRPAHAVYAAAKAGAPIPARPAPPKPEKPTPAASARDTACDAEKYKADGVELVGLGQHAAGLAQFEASLLCKESPHTRQLAFMSACTSGNAPKAKAHYKKLSPVQQQKLAMMCIRTNTKYE